MKPATFPYSRHRHPPPAAGTPALECIDATVRYPGADRPAVRSVNLSIPQGARVALIGANGAGKSTLLKAAAGLLPLTSGLIHVHGVPPRGCCHRVAYLAQRGDLDWRFPMTVRHLVLTGRYVHLGWFRRPNKEDHAIVDRVMDVLQIRDLAERRIGQLSGGQQQRTLLARAMAQEADMLLLDEPMNAVDPATRQIVRQVLRSLSETGKTIIVATHDMHEIQVQFETIVHLSCGCKEDAGSIEDISVTLQKPAENRPMALPN
ncbi:MAG TPA: ABC transporter ATP-binding protein [Tepidisphaeraceae bacterium]|nr:ABC transporter ATP-binding protein [Tepidisphaeraceae bacterium]